MPELLDKGNRRPANGEEAAAPLDSCLRSPPDPSADRSPSLGRYGQRRPTKRRSALARLFYVSFPPPPLHQPVTSPSPARQTATGTSWSAAILPATSSPTRAFARSFYERAWDNAGEGAAARMMTSGPREWEQPSRICHTHTHTPAPFTITRRSYRDGSTEARNQLIEHDNNDNPANASWLAR
jgi:hypothetical protein